MKHPMSFGVLLAGLMSVLAHISTASARDYEVPKPTPVSPSPQENPPPSQKQCHDELRGTKRVCWESQTAGIKECADQPIVVKVCD